MLASALATPSAVAELTVSAASSLGPAFTAIARAYEARRPGTAVRLNVGASDALLQQIARGAPVDVYASADADAMDRAAAQGLVAAETRRDFAANRVVLIVPAGPASPPRTLADLRSAAIRRIAVGQPSGVPIGRYAKHALDAAGLWDAVAAKAVYTHTARQSLDYVARGEVDAGFVYATDAALRASEVRVALEVPAPVPVRYPIAVVRGSAQPGAALGFVDFVSSAEAQALLAARGFLPP